MIGFNKPYISGNEFLYIQEAIKQEKLSGNGYFTKKCHEFFEKRYGFKKVLLTHSCTAALEMAAILLNIKEGDEVIVPSYTFVSTANAFLLKGASIVFADSNWANPNVSVEHIQNLITSKTKVIVVVHYAGIACDMDPIMELARRHGLFVVEDAAQAIDSYYKGRPLGSIGHLSAFSFHETKNIISGEGGMLVINDERFMDRAEIIWEKGTNRSAFFRGEVDKYTWIDIGSSFLPSELTAAFLLAQLEKIDEIQSKRKQLWEFYYNAFKKVVDESFRLPHVDTFATNNGHLFYLVTKDLAHRSALLEFLKAKEIQCIFHYLPLHKSPYFTTHTINSIDNLPQADSYGDGLFRLPLYFELTFEQATLVVDEIKRFSLLT